MALRGQDDRPESEKTGINKLFDIHKPVFWPSVILITVLIAGTLIAGEAAENTFSAIQSGITEWAS